LRAEFHSALKTDSRLVVEPSSLLRSLAADCPILTVFTFGSGRYPGSPLLSPSAGGRLSSRGVSRNLRISPCVIQD